MVPVGKAGPAARGDRRPGPTWTTCNSAPVSCASEMAALWCVISLLRLRGRGAGYLTVSEVFPMEIRAMAIAVFYAIATALGGISGPVIFGNLIGTGNVTNLFIAYLLARG